MDRGDLHVSDSANGKIRRAAVRCRADFSMCYREHLRGPKAAHAGRCRSQHIHLFSVRNESMPQQNEQISPMMQQLSMYIATALHNNLPDAVCARAKIHIVDT